MVEVQKNVPTVQDLQVMHIGKSIKKDIPRVSRDIYANSMPIRKHALYEGDFVFFATSGGDRITHVGIYLWDGFFAHASSSKGVTISNLRQGYYQKTFCRWRSLDRLSLFCDCKFNIRVCI